MKYLLMIYGNQSTWDSWSEQDQQEVIRAHTALQRELTESGELIGSHGLTTIDARTVRVSGGVPAVTDGPFTEAKEVLAGYYVVDCTPERATEIAAESATAGIVFRPLPLSTIATLASGTSTPSFSTRPATITVSTLERSISDTTAPGTTLSGATLIASALSKMMSASLPGVNVPIL